MCPSKITKFLHTYNKDTGDTYILYSYSISNTFLAYKTYQLLKKNVRNFEL